MSVAPLVTVLTAQPAHPSLRALVDVGATRGLAIRCAPRVDPASALVFQWSYPRLAALAAVRQFCAHHRIEHVNTEPLSKWEQLARLADAGVPIPNSRRAPSLEAARAAAALLRYPVVIKPNWGLKSRGVELVADEAALNRIWQPTHRLVQSYLPARGRCTRILVIGEQARFAVTRVAHDGFHATYDHGRRGWLEPYALTPARAQLAVAACRAVGVDVGGVDLVETDDGPCILEVNHLRVEFGDRQLHGPDAIGWLAAWLAERAQRCPRREAPPPPAPRVHVVTRRGREAHELEPLLHACREQGLAPRVVAAADPTADATWFWSPSPAQHRRALARLGGVAMPLVNGHASCLWTDRTRLFRAGLPVPRSRMVSRLDDARAVAAELGYPLTLRRGGRRALRITDEAALATAWPTATASGLLEPARYATLARVRIFVAGERAFLARRLTRGRPRPLSLQAAPCDLAIAACRALAVDAGRVDLALPAGGDGEPTVLQVRAGMRWLGELSPAAARAALQTLATTLRQRLDGAPRPPSRPSPRRRPLTVLLARAEDAPGSGHCIGNIQALQRELARRGHRLLALDGRFDRALVDGADLILQDPVQALGLGTRGDELDRFLHERAAERCHLLRQLRAASVDKRAMHALALELGLRTPALYRRHEVTAAELPLIAKPRRGSLGLGVRRVASLAELARLPERGYVLQQLIDARAASAVSIRVVTVVDRVVAAALFHNARSICSNLARGGRAIPLSGPGQRLRLTRAEQAILEQIGLDSRARAVPAEVAAMAAIVGRHHARRGAQMLGQDFVVDDAGRWYFLELNLGFGTAVFNATDGQGFPSSGRGLAHAGRLLADAVEERFAREER